MTRLRLAELLATVSYAGDAGMGLPDEVSVRCAVLASALGDEIGATDEERADCALTMSPLVLCAIVAPHDDVIPVAS